MLHPVSGYLREARPANGDPGFHHRAGPQGGGQRRLRVPQGQGVWRRGGVPRPRHRPQLARHLLRHVPLQDHQSGRVDQLRLPRQHRERVARRVQLHGPGRRGVPARAVVAAAHQGRGGQVPHRRLHQRKGVAAGVLLIGLGAKRIHVY
jgi:hypothetical protein